MHLKGFFSEKIISISKKAYNYVQDILQAFHVMSYIHIENYTVRTSEINHAKRIHPHALIQLMQESSMQHTIGMKVSLWDLQDMQGSWVLLKMDVRFYSLPLLNDTITIETFPSGKEGYFTYRDYLVFDRFHQLCATASSVWTMMHTETRKMIRIPDEFGKLVCHTDNPLPKPDFRLSPVLQSDSNFSIKVNYLHLDWNGHVNNVAMCRLIMESLDPDIFYQKTLKQLLIQFKSEAILGQTLLFENHHDNEINKISHSVKNSENGKDIVLAETYWVDI
ncbi:MAG: acyl-ACP thioesterase domain-containing protein [Saprospiraceae bacterium]|jgi:acyl-ACP thioesterase